VGRHRGSKTRSADEALEQKWRRLLSAGRVEARPGLHGEPPWLDAHALLWRAINAHPGGYPDETCTQAERETLFELAVNACVRNGKCTASEIGVLASAIRTNSRAPDRARALLTALAEAYPEAGIEAPTQ
jgi:hypothetical protein